MYGKCTSISLEWKVPNCEFSIYLSSDKTFCQSDLIIPEWAKNAKKRTEDDISTPEQCKLLDCYTIFSLKNPGRWLNTNCRAIARECYPVVLFRKSSRTFSLLCLLAPAFRSFPTRQTSVIRLLEGGRVGGRLNPEASIFPDSLTAWFEPLVLATTKHNKFEWGNLQRGMVYNPLDSFPCST